MNYEATIEDPEVFTRPWKMRMIFYRRLEEHFRILEFLCWALPLEKYYRIPQSRTDVGEATLQINRP